MKAVVSCVSAQFSVTPAVVHDNNPPPLCFIVEIVFDVFHRDIYLLLFMRTRCDISDKNLAFFLFPELYCFTVTGWMLQWSSANKNKCSRKIGEKRVDFAPLFRIKLCFPSFLLDKVSQPIPYKGHRRRSRTNSGGHGSFLQMKALNFSIVQLIQIILKEKYFCKLFQDSAACEDQR